MSNIKSITKKRITTETLWNLAVEKDESFIANGIVVHNCRSLLVPITKYETWEADAKANNGQGMDKFIKDNLGDGFSVQ